VCLTGKTQNPQEVRTESAQLYKSKPKQQTKAKPEDFSAEIVLIVMIKKQA